MKLQFNRATIVAFAGMVGDFVELEESTRRVLDVFAREGHDPFTRRDVVAVLAAMPGSPDDPLHDDDGWKTIDSLVQACQNTGKRGYYTQEGMTRTMATPTPAPPPTPVPSATTPAVSLEDVVVIRKAGLSWVPTEAPSSEDLEGYYKDDMGLRRLAINSTKCFGDYVATDAACQACPLAQWCSRGAFSALGSIAEKLDQETERAIRDAEVRVAAAKRAAEAAKRAAEAPAPVAPTHHVPRVPVTPPKTTTALPAGHTFVDLPFEGVCSKCDLTIKAEAKAVHVAGAGMFHPDCASAL